MVKRRVLSATPLLLGALLHHNPVLAQDFDHVSMGIFLGYTTGEAGGFTWGAEGFISNQHSPGYGEPDHSWSWGPLARLSIHGFSSSFVSVGASARYGSDVAGVRGEAGATVAFLPGSEPSKFSPYTGLASELVILEMFAREYWLLNSFSFGGGVLWPPPVSLTGGGEVATGRPQRDAEGRKVATTRIQPGVAGEFLRAGPMNATLLLAALAEDWQTQAQQEYDSVPAFLDLAAQLRAAQAPRSLVVDALRAAQDELKHAQMAAALCARFGGTPALKVPRATARPPLTGDAALERLAVEAWRDGCLGEGIAAALAADEMDHALDPVLVATQRRIARDEARHAELAWRTVVHCLERKPGLYRSLQRPIPVPSPPAVRVGNSARREWIATRHTHAARTRLEQMA